MKTGIKIKLLGILAVIILILAGAGYWYFSIYTKSPDYSLKQIERSFNEHNKELFNKYVNLDGFLDSSYGGFVAGIMGTEHYSGNEAKVAVENLANMMKAPVISIMKEAINKYVEDGQWATQNQKENESGADAEQILLRSGLKSMEFRDILNVDVSQDKSKAIAMVKVFQSEVKEDFVFEVVLRPGEDGVWRVEEIANLGDFASTIGRARKREMENYMTETASIIRQHDESMHLAELKRQEILSSGSLGNQETRDALKKHMEEVEIKDWEKRMKELEAVLVPESAMTIQHLRLKICTLHIEYAKAYAEWMTDKKASTIKDADGKLKQARTLEQEEKVLVNRMSAN